MKTSSAAAPVKRSTAMNCLLMNQFATPGLGSLMGRRIVAGVIQLSLAVIGFGLLMGYFIKMIMGALQMTDSQPGQTAAYSWMGESGALSFAASWLLSWITSLSLLREARQNPETRPPAGPPPPPARPQPPLLK